MKNINEDDPTLWQAYGWPIAILFILVGVVLSLNFFHPTLLIPSYCTFDNEFLCKSYTMSQSHGIAFILTNKIGSTIRIKQEHITVQIGGRTLNWGNCLINGQKEIDIRAGKAMEIICEEQLPFEVDSKQKAKIVVKYIKQTYPTPVEGKIYTKITR